VTVQGSTPLERTLADACFELAAGADIGADARGFVAKRGVARDDADAIASAPPRLAVYRSLVQNGLKTVVGKVLARTRARLNASRSGRFDADFARFLQAVGPRTHYLRDVPDELLAWALPQWRADPAVPEYVTDLAIHESTEFTLGSAPDDAPGASSPVAIDRPLRFARAARLVRHAWRVHELSEDPSATDLPAIGPVALMAYRNLEQGASWLELTPLAASIVDALMAERALGDALEQACAAHHTTASAVAMDAARLLADLSERGIVLGAR
jgi:hypothetical protein